MDVPPPQVQVVENRSEVTGTVVRIAPHERLAGQSVVTLKLSKVAAVDAYANVLSEAEGTTVDIVMRDAEVHARRIAKGDTVTWIVKRTTPTSVAFVRESTTAMPVQPIENQADVTGTVRTVVPRTDLQGYYSVSLDVESVAAVADYANMFEWAKGQSIAVNVPADRVSADRLAPGQRVTWRVKRTGPTSVFLVPSDGK
jgi:hypothetical protein